MERHLNEFFLSFANNLFSLFLQFGPPRQKRNELFTREVSGRLLDDLVHDRSDKTATSAPDIKRDVRKSHSFLPIINGEYDTAAEQLNKEQKMANYLITHGIIPPIFSFQRNGFALFHSGKPKVAEEDVHPLFNHLLSNPQLMVGEESESIGDVVRVLASFVYQKYGITKHHVDQFIASRAAAELASSKQSGDHQKQPTRRGPPSLQPSDRRAPIDEQTHGQRPSGFRRVQSERRIQGEGRMRMAEAPSTNPRNNRRSDRDNNRRSDRDHVVGTPGTPAVTANTRARIPVSMLQQKRLQFTPSALGSRDRDPNVQSHYHERYHQQRELNNQLADFEMELLKSYRAKLDAGSLTPKQFDHMIRLMDERKKQARLSELLDGHTGIYQDASSRIEGMYQNASNRLAGMYQNEYG